MKHTSWDPFLTHFYAVFIPINRLTHATPNCFCPIMGAMASKPDPSMEGIKAYQVDRRLITTNYFRHTDFV